MGRREVATLISDDPIEREAALAAEPQRLAGAEAVLAAADGRHRSHQEHSYLARSRYEQQLQRLEAFFADEQLLVLRSEDLFEQPERIWLQVLAFLDLEFMPLPMLDRPANAGQGEAREVPETTRRRLRAQLEDTYQWASRCLDLHWD